MRSMFSFPLLALVLMIFQGCSSLNHPHYRPYSEEVGYSDLQITKDTWEVEYVGLSTMTELHAKELAILRAAELTHLMGGRWFTLVSEAKESRRVSVTSEKVEHTPAQATDSASKSSGSLSGGEVTTKVVTRADNWIPHILLRFRMERTESAESLDAESVLRMGRAKRLLARDST
ncbi:MAG TPA: hypothetical protein VK465_19250 [Fibrobacteria bacterium]|nr:hypothetical protein [Fibrobacteria bacterium]